MNFGSGGIPGLANIESILRLIAGNIALLKTAITDAFPLPLTSSAVWNPGSIADTDQETTTVSCAGAILGQRATATFSLDLQGLTLSAYVSAADTVTAVLSNLTGAPVNLASGTVKVWVTQS